MSNVMPTAKQRMRLQELSMTLFKASSKWQKIMRDTKIPSAELDRKATIDPNDPKFKMVYRSPTIEETLAALEDNLIAFNISKLPKAEQMETLARQFVDSTLQVRLLIQIDDKDLEESEQLFALLDKETADRVKALVVPGNSRHDNAFVVRGVDFLTEVIYLKKPELKEPEEAHSAEA